MTKIDRAAAYVAAVLAVMIVSVPASRAFAWELVRWVGGMALLGLLVIWHLIVG